MTDESSQTSKPTEVPTINPLSQPLPSVEEAARANTGALVTGSDDSTTDFREDEQKQRFLWNVHTYVNEYVRFADSKAGVAGTLAGALLAGLYGAEMYVPLFTATWSLTSCLIALATLSLAVSVGLSVLVVLPRLGTSQDKGFVYWQNIAAHGSSEQFRAAFGRASTRHLNDHLLHHLYDLSTSVSIPKYWRVTICIWCLVLGGFLAAVALVIGNLTAAIS